jgi:hypothetical protein
MVGPGYSEQRDFLCGKVLGKGFVVSIQGSNVRAAVDGTEDSVDRRMVVHCGWV